MKIVVTGTRGIPNIQGGVETHCEELFPRISKLGFEVCIIRRSCYIPAGDTLSEFKGVKLRTLYAPHLKSLEAILHTFLAVIWAKKHKADIIHIHAIGPAIMVPFARLLGLKVVFTHHGPDYDRSKWGRFAKLFLKTGERFGTYSSNEIIVISEVIKKSLSEKYNRNNTHLIFNGVVAPCITGNTAYIRSLGLVPGKYVFTLGRFVEEKGFDLLIRTFKKLNKSGYTLVIAGDSDHETAYSKRLKALANDSNVVLTGFIKGDNLNELFSHARLFVLPSFHEGLPISLLEAMSYNLPVLVSDIPANKQVNLPQDKYFITGDEESLLKELDSHLNTDFKPIYYDLTPYNWDKIAIQTSEIYNKIHFEHLSGRTLNINR
jgi:glycosyltransferase involved in cell wall biosynthesis